MGLGKTSINHKQEKDINIAPEGQETYKETEFTEEEQEWTPDAGSVEEKGLLGKAFSPISDSFDSLSTKQKGQYVLIIGIVSILIGAALLVKLLVENL